MEDHHGTSRAIVCPSSGSFQVHVNAVAFLLIQRMGAGTSFSALVFSVLGLSWCAFTPIVW